MGSCPDTDVDPVNVQIDINPSTDQHFTSPYNIDILSSKQVMRMKELVS